MASRGHRLLDDLESRETTRFVDLSLAIRHHKTKETLLWAGGQWDRIDQRFTDIEPSHAQIIDVHEGQAEFVVWFARWLADFREGFQRNTSLALAGGDRRGGKTFDLFLCQNAMLIDVPKSIGWAVSVSNNERDELDRQRQEILLSSWYVYRSFPSIKQRS